MIRSAFFLLVVGAAFSHRHGGKRTGILMMAEKFLSKFESSLDAICPPDDTVEYEFCRDAAAVCTIDAMPPGNEFRNALTGCQGDQQFADLMSEYEIYLTSSVSSEEVEMTEKMRFKYFFRFLEKETTMQEKQDFYCCISKGLGLFTESNGNFEFNVDNYKKHLKTDQLKAGADTCNGNSETRPVGCNIMPFKKCLLEDCLTNKEEQYNM